MDMNLDIELGKFAKYEIQRNSYSTAWMASDISQRNFQWRYILLSPFHDEKKMTSRVSKIHTAIGTALQAIC
jgi:hypothetical protein